MLLTLLVRMDSEDGLSLWRRQVDRPYSAVPSAGDSIFLGDDEADPAGGLPAVVADVTWHNDGNVALSFDIDSADREQDEAELERLGFQRIQ
jgi:hypothetical protein